MASRGMVYIVMAYTVMARLSEHAQRPQAAGLEGVVPPLLVWRDSQMED